MFAGAIVFFVASRGHHADVGGIAPGSMPPLSKTLEEEGSAIIAFKVNTYYVQILQEKSGLEYLSLMRVVEP